MQKYAVIVAGGSGSRMKSEIPKQFIQLNGFPILMHTMKQFHLADSSTQIILVLPASQFAYWDLLIKEHKLPITHQVVEGGKSRFQSVNNGLNAITENNSLVAIHDGVRPFISKQLIDTAFQIAEETGNAVVSMPLKDSIRHLHKKGNEAKPRKDFRIIQTPQTFQTQLIKNAFETEESPIFTDDATVLEHQGHAINLIEGDYRNIKLTTPEDLEVATVFAKHFPTFDELN